MFDIPLGKLGWKFTSVKEADLTFEPYFLIDYSWYKLIWKEKLIFNIFNMVHVGEKTDVYNRKPYCAEGLIKTYLQGSRLYVTGQIARAIVSPVWIEWWLRWLIITIINDPFLKGKQKEEVWCQYQAGLYDCSSIITSITVYGNIVQKVNILLIPMI